MSPIKIDEILDRIPKMADTAIVPVPSRRSMTMFPSGLSGAIIR